MPEVVDEGVTGYLVDGVEAAAEAVAAAARLDRRQVSARARERFSAERMVADYLRVYQRLLSR
jgi:glycosyltransferase involved in cell wall biosynthesis